MNARQEKALDIVARLAGCDRQAVRPEMDLVADLGIDSPKALALICDIEEDCGIEVPDDVFDEIHTVQDLLAIVRAGRARVAV